jgi:hypothetical protein
MNMKARKCKELNHAGNVAVVELAKWELNKYKHQVQLPPALAHHALALPMRLAD